MPDAAVTRPLKLASPQTKGEDVSALQAQINKQFRRFNIDRSVRVDGVFGPQTFLAAKQCALCLGATGLALKKLKRNTLSIGTQKLIRGRQRTAGESVVIKARSVYRSRLRKRYAKLPGELAVAAGLKLVGVTENPAGSNWGPQVGEFIKYTGYTGPVYWCGCFACWVVCKLGGAKITSRIRMGYAPYITADALAGANGFTAVPIEDARAGDVICLWGGQHIEVVISKPKAGLVKCLGGNTSSGGQESNGGGVFVNLRSTADADKGIVARPTW